MHRGKINKLIRLIIGKTGINNHLQDSEAQTTNGRKSREIKRIGASIPETEISISSRKHRIKSWVSRWWARITVSRTSLDTTALV